MVPGVSLQVVGTGYGPGRRHVLDASPVNDVGVARPPPRDVSPVKCSFRPHWPGRLVMVSARWTPYDEWCVSVDVPARQGAEQMAELSVTVNGMPSPDGSPRR